MYITRQVLPEDGSSDGDWTGPTARVNADVVEESNTKDGDENRWER